MPRTSSTSGFLEALHGRGGYRDGNLLGPLQTAVAIAALENLAFTAALVTTTHEKISRELKDAGAFSFRKLPNGMSVDTTNQLPADTARLISDYVASF